MQNVSTDKLMHDLRAVVADAEELLKATAAQTGERVDKVRAKAEESVRAARARIQEMGDSAHAQAREVDQQVRENPWTAVGIAAGVGLVLGILIGRR